jgi:hypothetical protein
MATKSATGPNTAALETELNEDMTPEEQAEQDAESQGVDTQHLKTNDDLREQPDKGDTGAKKGPPESIPYSRFQEVNERAKKVEQELDAERKSNSEVREKWARIEERQNMAREALPRMRRSGPIRT